MSYAGNRGLEYYKAYPRDFFEGTIGMDGKLKGFYRLVLDMIYMHDGMLRTDWRHIGGLSGCSPIIAKRQILTLVDIGKLQFSDESCEFLTQNRIKSELKSSRKFQETQRNNAMRSNKNKDLPEAMAVLPQDHKTTRPQDKKEPPNPQGDLLGDQLPDVVVPIKPDLKAEFDMVWGHYPRRVGTGNARAAWIKARGKADFDVIAKPLGIFIRSIKDTPKNKIPHLSTWLNGERWLDDQTHAINREMNSDEQLNALMDEPQNSDDALDALFPELATPKQIGSK